MDDEEYGRRGRSMALRVFNARRLDPPATLAEEGFELVRIDTVANGRLRDDEVGTVFESEARALVERLTGCAGTRVFSRVRRNGFDGLPPGDPRGVKPSTMASILGYALRAHTDVSPWLEQQPEWNEFVGGRHGAVYNIWRSTDFGGPIEQMPLALCPLRNIDPCDMIPACSYSILPSGAGFVDYNLVRNPFQRWFFYPRMAPDEVLIFKLYDTREGNRSRRGVFHVAVKDPSAPPEARTRTSMELRVGALFEDEDDQEARRARFLAELPPVPDTIHLRLGGKPPARGSPKPT